MKTKILVLGAIMLVCAAVGVRAGENDMTIGLQECRSEMISLKLYSSCRDGKYRFMSYSCMVNGVKKSTGIVGDAKSCELEGNLKKRATEKCRVTYCAKQLTPTPIIKCIPKPACVDGIVDPWSGEKVYCDPKPGTVYCTPTPIRPMPTIPRETNCKLLKETQGEYFSQCAKAGFRGTCFDIYTSVFQGCSNLGEKNDCVENNVNAKRNVLCMAAVVEPTKKPTAVPMLKPACVSLGGYCENSMTNTGKCLSGYGEVGVLMCNKSSHCCLPDKCKLWPKGDINCSGKIDVVDIALWQNERIQALRGMVGAVKNSYKSDLNNDGVVDMVDFEILKDGFLEGLR